MTRRIYLRPPTLEDQQELLALARASRALHRPWVRAPETPKEFAAYLRHYASPSHRSYLICRRDTRQIAGVVHLSEIVRGIFRSAYLGYWAFAGCERQGLMREGLEAVVRRAFSSLKLHRLEANIQPGNVASIALAKACGFHQEGYSPRYLKIGGRWRDHERWAILAS